MTFRTVASVTLGVVALAAVIALVGAHVSGSDGPPPRHVGTTSDEHASTTTTTIVPVAPCRLTDLDGAVVDETGAVGSQYVQVALHGYGRTGVCSLKGTPTVVLLGTGDAPLPSSETDLPKTEFTGRGNTARLVLLSATTADSSSWASFTLVHTGPMTLPRTRCPATSAIAVGLPGASGTVVVPAVLRVYGSYPEGACGAFGVGSFYAGLGPQPGAAGAGS